MSTIQGREILLCVWPLAVCVTHLENLITIKNWRFIFYQENKDLWGWGRSSPGDSSVQQMLRALSWGSLVESFDPTCPHHTCADPALSSCEVEAFPAGNQNLWYLFFRVTIPAASLAVPCNDMMSDCRHWQQLGLLIFLVAWNFNGKSHVTFK